MQGFPFFRILGEGALWHHGAILFRTCIRGAARYGSSSIPLAAFQCCRTFPWVLKGPAWPSMMSSRSCHRRSLSAFGLVSILQNQSWITGAWDTQMETIQTSLLNSFLCVSQHLYIHLCSSRRRDMVWAAGAAGGGLPSRSLLPDGPLSFHERWSGHYP